MSVWGQIPSKLLTTQLALGSPRVRAAPSNPPSAPYLLWLLFGHFTYLSSVLSSGKKKKNQEWKQKCEGGGRTTSQVWPGDTQLMERKLLYKVEEGTQLGAGLPVRSD